LSRIARGLLAARRPRDPTPLGPRPAPLGGVPRPSEGVRFPRSQPFPSLAEGSGRRRLHLGCRPRASSPAGRLVPISEKKRRKRAPSLGNRPAPRGPARPACPQWGRRRVLAERASLQECRPFPRRGEAVRMGQDSGLKGNCCRARHGLSNRLARHDPEIRTAGRRRDRKDDRIVPSPKWSDRSRLRGTSLATGPHKSLRIWRAVPTGEKMGRMGNENQWSGSKGQPPAGETTTNNSSTKTNPSADPHFTSPWSFCHPEQSCARPREGTRCFRRSKSGSRVVRR
jgi:hypothetical protein